MAKNNSTATPEELALAEQFPSTNRPFGIWFNPTPEVEKHWVVNQESGEVIEEFSDFALALKAAAKNGKEWAAEARKQAQALARVIVAETRTAPQHTSIGFDVLMLRAHVRAAFALLHSVEGYGAISPEGEVMCDVGMALIDADSKLDEIHERIDAMGLA